MSNARIHSVLEDRDIPPKDPGMTNRVLTNNKKDQRDMAAIPSMTIVENRRPPLKKLSKESLMSILFSGGAAQLPLTPFRGTRLPFQQILSATEHIGSQHSLSFHSGTRNLTIKTACQTVASPVFPTLLDRFSRATLRPRV